MFPHVTRAARFRVPHLNSRRWVSNGSTKAFQRPTAMSSLSILGVILGAGTAGYLVGKTSPPSTSNIMSPNSTRKSDSLYGSPIDFAEAIDELRTLLPEDGIVSTDEDDLYHHGFSENDYHPGRPHSVVVYPRTTEDVVKVVQVANKYRMPVTPYSGATSLEGQFLGHATGGICVDMTNMNKIIEIHEEDSDLVCQPGIGWVEINETLKAKGIPLFFPIDPAPGATIGGMLSTGCSGTNAVRYGTSRGEWFLNVTVVLPTGEVIKTRQRSRKSSAGWDVTKLFIGAEGTLGIVTEVTIRLAPVLPTTVAAIQFADVRKATAAVIEVLNAGVGIQCVELLDSNFIRATNLYGQSSRKWAEKDTLYFKFQGPSPASIAETARIVKEITEKSKYGGTGWTLAKDEQEATDLWMDRKNAHYSGLALEPGARGLSTDVCVPVSKLPDLVLQTKADLDSLGLKYTMVGHVGDGNFHSMPLMKNDEDEKLAKGVVDRMVLRALALDGTCTGEHGVGVGKRKWLNKELGEGTVALMRSVKKTLDPNMIMNPGKVLPDEE